MSSSSFAGPFLRYGNCLPGSDIWTGSVLFLTRRDGAPDLLAVESLSKQDEIDDNKPEMPGPEPTMTLGEVNAGGHDGGNAIQQQPRALLLDTVLGWTFWRFDLKLIITTAPRPIHYSISVPATVPTASTSASSTFWLPALGQPMHWAYFSCNGLSDSVPEDSFARRDRTYLWRDLLQVHNAFPMHVLVGGGDQVYADAVWKENPGLKAWGDAEDLEYKITAEWTPDLAAEATASYLSTYLTSFTESDVATAYASIPSVFVWDDHDIWDGYGSYDDELQACAVFRGLFGIARRFYLLFQQHTTAEHEKTAPEFVDVRDGYHSVRYLGPQVALFAIDMRSKRSKRRILPESTYQLIRSESLELPESVRHVVIMSGVPVVFPKIPLSETVLTGLKGMFDSCAPCRFLGRRSGILDRFDQPEILDDLIDGWVANEHEQERHEFIKVLQEVALAKHVRVSIISGDAHVGGVGRLYSRPKRPPAQDPLFMAQIISSAIMNAPPPRQVVGMLMRTDLARNIDERTRTKMERAFWPNHPRTDKLIRRRNWCDVTFIAPPNTAPMNPADPEFGGLRFRLRVEDPELWTGGAEEVYDVIVPRAPI